MQSTLMIVVGNHTNFETYQRNKYAHKRNENYPHCKRRVSGSKVITMGGALVYVEPSNLTKAKKDPHVWRIMYEGELSTFIEHYKGGDDRLFDMIVRNWSQGKCTIHGKEVLFSNKSIIEVMGLPN